MNDILIVGASGFGREVANIIEENGDYDYIAFIDDDLKLQGKIINGYEVEGTVDDLFNREEPINVVIAIADPHIRMAIAKKLIKNKNISFPNIISKYADVSQLNRLGIGNIICQGSVLTVGIKMGSFNHINLNCTVGHDAIVKDCITVYPGVNISGNVRIDDYCELGTGSQIIQGKYLAEDVILGAGAVVINDIIEKGTYVGVPVKKVK